VSGARCRFAYGPANDWYVCLPDFTFLVPAHLGSPGQHPEGCKIIAVVVVVVVVHTHTQLFHGSMDFVWDNPGEPVPEETFTHLHLSWSSIVPYLLYPSTTIHGILPVQSTCLTVFFHNLSPSFLWLTSWPGTHFILHTFLQ